MGDRKQSSVTDALATDPVWQSLVRASPRLAQMSDDELRVAVKQSIPSGLYQGSATFLARIQSAVAQSQRVAVRAPAGRGSV